MASIACSNKIHAHITDTNATFLGCHFFLAPLSAALQVPSQACCGLVSQKLSELYTVWLNISCQRGNRFALEVFDSSGYELASLDP